MRILHTVELYEPSVGGAQEVVKQLSTRMAAAGHEVTVATSALRSRRSVETDGVRIKEFRVRGNLAKGLRGEVEAYRRFVRTGGFDLMMGYAAQQWTVDALLPELAALPFPTLIAPCGFSGLHDPAYRDYFQQLPHYLAAADGLIFHSERYQDIQFARAAGLAQLHVIPNGADEREFGNLAALDERAAALRARLGVDPATPLLLTVGSHTGEKGHSELLTALSYLTTTPLALLIVGNRPLGIGCWYSCRLRGWLTSWRSGGRRRALIAELSRPDLVAAYRAADLFVLVSAVECSPLVLFETLAAGTPFASAEVGNAAEIVAWSQGAGVLIPTVRGQAGRARCTPSEIAQTIDRLLCERPTLDAMGARGRAAWEHTFTWSQISARYEQLYRDVSSHAHPPRAACSQRGR